IASGPPIPASAGIFAAAGAECRNRTNELQCKLGTAFRVPRQCSKSNRAGTLRAALPFPPQAPQEPPDERYGPLAETQPGTSPGDRRAPANSAALTADGDARAPARACPSLRGRRWSARQGAAADFPAGPEAMAIFPKLRNPEPGPQIHFNG